MTTAALPAELLATASGFSSQAGVILRAIAALIARAFLEDPRHLALITPLWRHFTRAALRLDRAISRLAAGTPPSPSRPGRASRKPRAFLPLPSRFAWLSHALGDTLRHHGNGYASQLNHLLAQPETAALIAQSPQTARILRPICRFLGIRPDALPPLPRRKRATPTPLPADPAPEPPKPFHLMEPPCPRSRWPWVNRQPAPLTRTRMPEATLDIAIFQRE